MNKLGKITTSSFYSRLCIFSVITIFYFQTNAIAQNISIDKHYWSEHSSASTQSSAKLRIRTRSARALNLQFDAFSKQVGLIGKVKPDALHLAGATISLPLPDGTFGQYRVAESPIMSDELAQKVPQIKTYAGQGITDPTATIRFDITPKGFHAMIIKKDRVIYVDPAYDGNTTKYMAYYKRDYIREGSGFFEEPDHQLGKEKKAGEKKKATSRTVSSRASGSEIRTYRLAVAATGEYTAFHGESVELGLAAITTSINRVNGIYEREVAIRMILIGDNDQIIYTDSLTDPYTNSNSELLLNENQTNLDNVIGTANYDIGHVFSTGNGGLATEDGVCSSNSKARGTTGRPTPQGDPFDVDFVAHEIGHQFGATHTFNGTDGNCNAFNRSALTSYEPGSGTTIMGYAGICDSHNIQTNSDDYFHTVSYDQIAEFITNGIGNSCGSSSSTGNTPPTVNAGADYFIPVNTPFTLTGSGSDPDGDPLTYCWEQFDLGPAGPPDDPNTTGPLFRSFPPVNAPSRTFPQLSDILNNTTTLGEILPAIKRSMEFRLTVRDNKSGGGGVNYDNMTVNVADVPAKFEITNFNQPQTIQSGFPENITWEVANTDLPPINTQLVNILLSTDGGLTFPLILAQNVDNDGFETVIFPDNPTDQARIKIEAANNIYFDINNQDFSIEAPAAPDFAVVVDPISSSICIPSDAIFTVEVISVLGFSDPVNFAVNNLPAGVAANFSDNPVIPGNSTTLTITNTGAAAPDEYSIELASSAGSQNNQNEINLSIQSTIFIKPEPLSPGNGAVDVALVPSMSWVDNPEIEKYTFELALDPDFNNIIDSVFDLSEPSYQLKMPLESNKTFYWRVIGTNSCGTGEYSETFSFTTLTINYFSFESTDVPKIIEEADPNTVTSILEIQIVEDLIISDLNVINLKGEHTFINDLSFTLRSPVGTEVTLFANICSSEANFDLSLDDESPNTIFDCPPTSGEAYTPAEPLSDFNGENARGTWTLIVEDNAPEDGGILNAWALEIGTRVSRPKPPFDLQASPRSVNAITLTWEDGSNNEDSFVLERSTFNNSNFEEVVTLNANSRSFTDEGLIPETNYVYRIRAVNEFGVSDYSPEVETATLPVAPRNLVATVLSVTRIGLTWSDLSAAEEGYIIERSEGDNENFVAIHTTAANIRSYIVTGLAENTTYYFRVYAQNQFGQSSFSEEVNATTLVVGIEEEIAQTIAVFPNPTENNVRVEVEKAGFSIEGIRLSDIHGKAVRYLSADDIKRQGNPLTLEMNTNAKGMYLLEIVTDQAIVIKRIIKK